MSQLYCTQCGAQQRRDSDFCTNCGATVKSSPAKNPVKLSPRTNRRSARPWPGFLVPALFAGAVVVLAGAVYLAFGQDRQDPPPAATSSIPDEHSEDGLPYPEVPRIVAAEARARADSGQAILVDVRSQGEYDTAHAEGAMLLSLADLEARYRELPQNAEIITYCT